VTASRWRKKSREVIAKVFAETEGQPVEARQAALQAAYPFGPKTHYPCKIWREEIAVAYGRPRKKSKRKLLREKAASENQMELVK